MNKVGLKTRAWTNARNRLKKRFAANGITECELGYDGCWRDNALSFAHGRRRRFLLEGELEHLTVLCCTPCHERLDRLPPAATLAIVRSVIAERGIR